MLRGRLTQAIQSELAQNDKDHQARWDKIWDSKLCQKYKRSDHADYWLWNNDFYGAIIMDLRAIAALVGVEDIS